MEAKLPVSALLHSATLVASGLFITLRLMPFYVISINISKTIAVVGLLTALICSLSACAQDKPKKVLAYSTSAQFGLMFFAVGMMNIKAAIIYFIAHAFIKPILFLALPKQDSKWNYIDFIIFMVAGLSLSGLIFSGMIAKEFIALNLGLRLTVVFSIISFLTAFYITRIALLMAKENELEKKSVKNPETFALLGFLGLNILFYIFVRQKIDYKIAEPFWAALTAWICVYVLYIKNAFWKVPFLYSVAKNGFYLDKFYTNFCANIYTSFARLCNKFDSSVLSNYFVIKSFAKYSVKTFSFIEQYVMNGTVEFVRNSFNKLSMFDLKAQSGNIQQYNAYAFIIITLIIIGLIFAYFAIISYMGG